MIYILEDEDNIRLLLSYTLTNMGFSIKEFNNASDFEAALLVEIPDLCILDLMLPDKDGITIIKDMKENIKYKDVPILILSAKSNEYDKVQGLDSGADDYLTKPFGQMELLARVKALLRRSQKNNDVSSKSKCIGDLEFIDETREFVLSGQVLDLTNKEYQLLEIFIENQNIALSRDQLLNAVWGYDYDGESRTVDVHVASLRNKLGSYGKNIKTIRSYGYRFKLDQ